MIANIYKGLYPASRSSNLFANLLVCDKCLSMRMANICKRVPEHAPLNTQLLLGYVDAKNVHYRYVN